MCSLIANFSSKLTVPGPLGQLDVLSYWYSAGGGFGPRPGHISYRFGHEIISTAILSLPLIPIEQLSITGESMGTLYWLTA